MNLRLAVQLYTLRHLSDDLPELLRVVADAGYDGVELVHDPNLDADAARAALERHGLVAASAHVGLDALEADLDGALALQRALGNDTVVVPWLAPEARPDGADGWRALGARLGRLAERCRASGFALLYHHHDFELARLGDRLALDHLLEAGAALGLELDVGWCRVAGVDPRELIDRYAGRLARLHVKDRAPDGENADQDGWADVGHGVIEWPPILAAAQNAGVPWFVVEHDAPADPVATITRSLAYLRGL